MKGISGKLVAWLVSLSVLILLLVGVMEYHAGNLMIEQKLDRSFQTMKNRLSHNLRNSVYSFDIDGVKDIVLSEFPNKSVYAIMVWTENRKQLLVGLARDESTIVDVVKSPEKDDLIQRSFSINYQSLAIDEVSTIGEVDMYLDRSVLEDQLVDSLVVNLSKVSLVIIIVLVLFELIVSRSLIRPLEHIYARIYATGSEEDKKEILNNKLTGFSELRDLDETYQMMVETLKKRQKELIESEHNYGEIFNATKDSILLLNAKNGAIIDANTSMLKLFGYESRKEILKLNARDVFYACFLLSENEAMEKIKSAVEAGSIYFESNAQNLKGDPFWVEISLMASEIGGHDSVLAVIRDISKRKEYEEALQLNQKQLEKRVTARTRELEARNRELESFSYMVSHDLRAPLRSIDGFCQILKEDYESVLDEQGRTYLDNVRAASQRLGILIDDLLQLSRVTRHQLNVTSVDLSGLVNMIVEKLQQSSPDKKFNVTIARDVIADCDEVLLQVVMENLIGNAIKYSSVRDRPEIQFGVNYDDGEPIYFVRDNGVGFEMKYVHKIFLPFQRLHGREFEGTGIGLASVKTIIDHHKGKVWAESAPGKGTTFYFTLKSELDSEHRLSQQL